jgi:hypothetical protein
VISNISDRRPRRNHAKPHIEGSEFTHKRLEGRLALGPNGDRFLDYFEMSRRKGNVIDYDYASVAADSEAEEILSEAKAFSEFVGRLDDDEISFPFLACPRSKFPIHTGCNVVE